MARAFALLALAFGGPLLLTLGLEVAGVATEASVTTHGAVALTYFALAGVLATGLYMRGMSYERNLAARLFAVLFFIGCGSHHVDFAVHGASGEEINFGAVHHLLFGLWQVIGASGFLAMVGGSNTRGFYFGWGERRSAGAEGLRSGDNRLIDLLAHGEFIADIPAAREYVRAALDAERGRT